MEFKFVTEAREDLGMSFYGKNLFDMCPIVDRTPEAWGCDGVVLEAFTWQQNVEFYGDEEADYNSIVAWQIPDEIINLADSEILAIFLDESTVPTQPALQL